MGMHIPKDTWKTLGSVCVQGSRWEVNQHVESGQLGLIAYFQPDEGVEEDGVDVEEMQLEVLGLVAAKIFSIHCE